MRHIITFCLFCLLSSTLYAQTKISGTVTDNYNDPLIGASIVVKGTTIGTVADFEGNFSLTTEEKVPFTLIFSYIGFSSQEIVIKGDQTNMGIILTEESSVLDEIVVSASRVEEKILESPVSIEKLDLQSIKNSASADYYDQMTKLKGVTSASGSMTFNAINTRGFGGIANTRFVQLVDGIDNSAPLLNFPMGNLIGIGENDVKSVELVPGAASALYGPNAFNGIMLMTSKSPFDYEGLTVSFKGGITMARNEFRKRHPLYNADVRYAKTFGKFGFKVTASYLDATDWLANDYRTDIRTKIKYDKENTLFPEKVIGDRPADFNGINTYGDEGILTSVPLGQLEALSPDTYSALVEGVSSSETFQALFGGDADQARNFVAKNFKYLPSIGLRRTGLTEEDLLDNRKATSAKGTLALHYKPTNDVDINYAFRIGTGNSVYQGSERYALRNFYSFSNKIEATGKNFMIRSYMTQTNAGDSYNMTALGSYTNELLLGTADGWAAQYLGTFVGTLMASSKLLGVRIDKMNSRPNLMRVAFAEARMAADGLMPARGTSEFQEAIETIRGTYFQHADEDKGILGGAAFKDKSRLFHTEGTYDFTSLLKDKISILVGANHRMYSLFTDGTIFNEDPDNTGVNKRININEFGAFAQATKKLFEEKWRLSASIRYDKNENFKGVLSPRVASVISLGAKRQHNIRTSFQTGFRNPDTQAQYIYFPASAILLGGSRKNAERYGLYEGGSYTAESFDAFRASAMAGKADPSLLQEFYMDYIKPEKLSNIEIGYKTVVKNLYIDWNAYFNWYKDFIAQSNVVAKDGTEHKGEHIDGVNDFIETSGVAAPPVFRPYYNIDSKVTSWGTAIGLNYKAKRGFLVSANYNYMDYSADELAKKQGVDFNSPKHIVNLGVGNSDIEKTGFGFNISYRWQSAFFWVNSFGSGDVEDFHNIDATVSYNLKKWNTVFRLGGSNIFGNDYRTNIGGPYVGRTIFASITYDGSVLGGSKKKKK